MFAGTATLVASVTYLTVTWLRVEAEQKAIHARWSAQRPVVTS